MSMAIEVYGERWTEYRLAADREECIRLVSDWLDARVAPGAPPAGPDDFPVALAHSQLAHLLYGRYSGSPGAGSTILTFT